MDASPFSAPFSAHKLKPNTARNYRATRSHLTRFFGSQQRLADITAGDADQWREQLLMQLSEATVSREVKRARQSFRAAERRKLIGENPFASCRLPQFLRIIRGAGPQTWPK